MSIIFNRPRARRRWTVATLAIGALLAVVVAYGGSASGSGKSIGSATQAPAAGVQADSAKGAPFPAAAEEGPETPLSVAIVDRSPHSVPLEDIVFDTFGVGGARYVPLSEATDQLILNLRDAITPIERPAYGDAVSLNWLGDGDLVIGYESEGEAFAYPINILNFHEIVNDTIGGYPC